MTTKDIIELIFSGLTAFGTTGAVFISLWSTIRQKRRFIIEKVKVYRRINSDKTEENYLTMIVDNFQSAPMEVFSGVLIFINKNNGTQNSQGWQCTNEIIAPLSQNEIKFPLQHGWAAGSLKSADKIFCEIKTGFGTKRIFIPCKEKQNLCASLEM